MPWLANVERESLSEPDVSKNVIVLYLVGDVWLKYQVVLFVVYT